MLVGSQSTYRDKSLQGQGLNSDPVKKGDGFSPALHIGMVCDASNCWFGLKAPYEQHMGCVCWRQVSIYLGLWDLLVSGTHFVVWGNTTS